MAVFEIEAPDGSVYEIEGADEAGALAALKKHLGQPAQPSPASAPEAPQNVPGSLADFADRPLGMMGEVAATMANDLSAGFQGVNPVSLSQAPAIGVVIRDDMGRVKAIEQDGLQRDPSPFTPDKYVTRADPKTGTEFLYQRTPEMEESGLASAGRILGAGLPMASGRKVAPPVSSANEAMDALDVRPSVGMTGKTGAMLEAAAESNIVTSGPVTRDARRAAGEVADAAGRIAESAGEVSNRVDAGNMLRQGAETFKDAFQARSDKLYAKVGEALPKGLRVGVENTSRFLDETLQVFEGAPNIAKAVGNTSFQGWADDIAANGGRLTFEQLSALRTEVGDAMGKMTGPMADKAGGKLKGLYAALTQDMEAAAIANGAEAQWRRANQFYRAGRQRIDNALDIVFKPAAPEAVFEKVFALGEAKGQRANIGKLNAIKKSMSNDEWGSFVNSVITRMGQATPGAAEEGFSAATFLTNFRKIDPAARAVLFRGRGLPASLSRELDQLAEVAGTIRTAATETNRSRSGAIAQTIALTAGAMTDMGVTLTAAVLGRIGAHALTQPSIVRGIRAWAQGGTLYPLQQIANGRGPAAVEAGNILRLIEQQSATSGGN